MGPAHLRMVFHGFTPTDALDEFVNFTDNQVDVVSKAFLGLTVSCARCHDHKFDAISQKDYYAMFGVFANGRPGQVDAAADPAAPAEGGPGANDGEGPGHGLRFKGIEEGIDSVSSRTLHSVFHIDSVCWLEKGEKSSWRQG
jgi:hypothetical protein